MRSLLPRVACSLLALPAALGAQASLVDNFQGSSLHPAWSVSFYMASGWTHQMTGSALQVQDILGVPIGYWGGPNLEQNVAPTLAFDAVYDVGWQLTWGTVLNRINLLDFEGNVVAGVGLQDGWSHGSLKPTWYAEAGGVSAAGSHSYFPAPGRAVFRVWRDGADVIRASVDGVEVFSGSDSRPIWRVQLMVRRQQLLFFHPTTINAVSVTGGCGRGAELGAVPAQVSGWGGGAQNHTLGTCPARPGALYILLGSMTGTSPGFVFDGVSVPLNYDPYTAVTLTHANRMMWVNTFGTLDAEGRGAPRIVLPSRQGYFKRGADFDHAAVVFDPVTLRVVAASQAKHLRVTPW